MNVFKSLVKSGVRPVRNRIIKDDTELRPVYDHFKSSHELDRDVNSCKERPAIFLDSQEAGRTHSKFIDQRLVIARGS